MGMVRRERRVDRREAQVRAAHVVQADAVAAGDLAAMAAFADYWVTSILDIVRLVAARAAAPSSEAKQHAAAVRSLVELWRTSPVRSSALTVREWVLSTAQMVAADRLGQPEE